MVLHYGISCISFIPGAKAIRAVGRFWFYLSFPIAFVVAVRCNFIFAKKTIRFKSLVGAVLLMALFLSNMRAVGVSYNKMWRTDLEVDFFGKYNCTASRLQSVLYL